ncbi:type II secretion system protein N [Aliidiomarina sanyensis]|uniref:Type II secretion system protein N n=1 Tax=Aliidiomarina sanyensis TaxID=1249555 RepID=A0A432WGB4_9GAMM|nr:type II secretion system protein N [Aliidiomarina sanyensis]RUO32781.1 hypothetical protein CWE11_07030 [Aliidiomarina sanyensis]
MVQYLKKKRVLLPLLGVVYLVALITLMPARVIFAFAPIPENIQVGGVHGTIWNGTITRIRADDVALEGLEWRLHPLELLRLRVGADLRIPATEGNVVSGTARVAASANRVQLNDVRLGGELERLMGLMDFDSPIALRGAITLNIPEFVLGQPVCESLRGDLFGMQVEARLAQGWEALGDYDIALACVEGAIGVTMEPENLLGLSVQGNVSPQSTNLRIGIAPEPGAPRGIQDLLQWLGPGDDQGRRYFNFRL